MSNPAAPVYNRLHRMANEELARLVGGRPGPAHLRWPSKGPIMTLRCQSGHATARVYSTARGPLFVSWPRLSPNDQPRHRGIVVSSRRGWEQELVDLLEVDPDGPHPALLGLCRCGKLRPIDRKKLGSHLRSLRAGRTTKRDLVI